MTNDLWSCIHEYMVKGRGKANMHPTQFLLDQATHKKLRIAAIEAGVSMGEALREAVSLWLQSRGTRSKTAK